MTISEIQNIDLRGYNNKSVEELKEIVRQVAKVVNPKVNRLYRQDKSKIATDALEYMERSGDLISTTQLNAKYTTQEFLIGEIARGRYFLNLESSNVGVAREIYKQRADVIDDYLSNKTKKVEAIKHLYETKEGKELLDDYKINDKPFKVQSLETLKIKDINKIINKFKSKIIANEWESFHKFLENNPQYYADSERAYRVYKEAQDNLFEAQVMLDKYKQDEWEKLQNAYKQAEEATGYKPKWEGF